MFRNKFLWLLDVLGINAIFRLLNQNKALVLCYHGICDDSFDLLKGYDERQTPKSAFRQHLEYLKSKGYTFVTLSKLTDTIKNKGKINKFVVLTFDDGFKNVVENAYPIMQEYGAKGCFFLVSDLIGTDQLLWTDFVETAIRNVHADDIFFTFKGDEIRYKIGDKRSSEHAMKDIKAKLRTLPDKERIVHLRQFESYELKNIPKEFHMASWQEIKALDPDIFEIGSHTKMHPDCANLTSEEELKNEIHDSKIDIEKEIGRQIKHFCYPASSRNDTVTRFVKEYGYESAVTLRIGLNDINSDLYRLKRIESREEPLLFRASISGSLALIRRIRDLMP